MGEVRSAVDRHAREIRAAAARHHVADIRLFGSAARGDDHATSDADFLVSFDAEASILDLVHLQIELEEILRRPVDVVSVGGLKARDTHILEESVPL